MKQVSVVRAWPGRHLERILTLDAEAPVAGALTAIRLMQPDMLDAVVGYAVFGVRVQPSTPLHAGDRLELLEGLKADPKDARRRRAAASRGEG